MNIDEMIAVLTAFKEGKAIEIDINQNWFSINNNYKSWDFCNKTYRIAPEPKLVPFDYNDNLVGKIVKHKTIPYRSIIIAQDIGNCIIDRNFISYKDLLNNFTFLDGKPCGKYE